MAKSKTWLEMHAPKVDPKKVIVNMILRGEPQPWKRVTQAKFGKWRLVNPMENVQAQTNLRKAFKVAYPKFEAIEKRRLGVQYFFRTRFDSSDEDNLSKQVNDAFNKVIWADDRIIKEKYIRVDVTDRSEAFVQIVVYLLDYGQ